MAAPPALLVAAFLLGGCAGPNRPAWERSWGAAPASSSASSQPATAGSAKAAEPPAVSAATIERKTLPVPGAAGAAASAGKPATASVATAAAASGQALDAPTGAAGKLVAAAPPLPPKPAIDPAWTGVETHVARHEDTLLDLAVSHGLGFIEIAMANPGVDPWLPGEGTPVLLPKQHLLPDVPHQGLVLNLPEQRLYHFRDGKLVRSYPIGIGRDGHSTPVGTTSVVRKTVDPVWRPTPSARADDPELPASVPAGPDNPLGSRALYLGWTSYLIHGTNKEYGIGRRASRGCIRMYDRHVRELYERVAVGTPVTAVDQPIKVGWIGNELYIEASPTIAQVRQWEEEKRFDPVSAPDAHELVLRKAGSAAERIDWAAVDRAIADRRSIVTRITRPLEAKPMATASREAPSPAATAAGTEAPSATAPVARTKASATGRTATAAAEPTGDDLVKWLRGRLSSGTAQQ
ncbi:MAG: L,D-transpeptidase family protein [Rhodospirillales bacterium]|nr:L,D-transpeptidase family protein [Rhodospirillales bacterium]